MFRILPLDPSSTSGVTSLLLTAVKSKFGTVPNLMSTLAHSPAALEAFLGLKATLGSGVLPPRVREQIALAVAEAHGCDYCLAAHSLAGKAAGLSREAIMAARRGEADDAKSDALLKLTLSILRTRGQISDEMLAAARDAGVTNAEIMEIIGHIALNILTNYANHVARPVVDFPRAVPLAPIPVGG